MKKNSPTPKKKLWFRAKNYGWGWCPSSWQGWTVVFLFVILEVINFIRIDSTSHSSSDTMMNFTPQTIVMVLILIYICYKTGEKPSWRWGNKKSR